MNLNTFTLKQYYITNLNFIIDSLVYLAYGDWEVNLFIYVEYNWDILCC